MKNSNTQQAKMLESDAMHVIIIIIIISIGLHTYTVLQYNTGYRK